MSTVTVFPMWSPHLPPGGHRPGFCFLVPGRRNQPFRSALRALPPPEPCTAPSGALGVHREHRHTEERGPHPSVGVVSFTAHGGPFLLLHAVLPGCQGPQGSQRAVFQRRTRRWGVAGRPLDLVPEETLPSAWAPVGGQPGQLPVLPHKDAAHPEAGQLPHSPCCSEPSRSSIRDPHIELNPQHCGVGTGGRFLGNPKQPGPEAGPVCREKAGASLRHRRRGAAAYMRTAHSLAGSFLKPGPGERGPSGWGPCAVLGAGWG